MVVIISTLFLFSLAYFFQNQTKTFFYTISLPIWSVSDSSLGIIQRTKEYFIFKDSLVRENLSLREEVENLKLLLVGYGEVQKENQFLKDRFTDGLKTNRILSKILSKPPRSPYDTFVIDVGASQGVSIGNKVYVSDNIIVGIVKSVTQKTSLVELFSNPGTKQDTRLSRTGSTFVLTGKGGANLILDVPKDTDIQWGDVFSYPNIDSSVIGVAYFIDTNSQSAFKTIHIRIPGNIFVSDFVEVGL